MWGKHDDIRGKFKKCFDALKNDKMTDLEPPVEDLVSQLRNMAFMEEKILFPTSLEKLNDNDWAEIRDEESEIGYAWIKPGNLWDSNIVRSSQKKYDDDTYHLDQGELKIDQINLLLKNLPVDVTFVDENDKVRYYSQGIERIFPRSPSIIGRDVQNCHPPKSVHIVAKIVESFKKKEKSEAEFWLQMNGRFIHIRYFPLYDEAGKYRGVIEVSQDVTGIRSLEGEKRLLDW